MTDAPLIGTASGSPFWMVWCDGKRKGPARRHDTKESADTEANRLATRHPGKAFFVLQAVSHERIDAATAPAPDASLTGEAHRQRHVELHRMLDELYADFLRHNSADDMARARAGEPFGLERPIGDLLKWSYEQTQYPTEA